MPSYWDSNGNLVDGRYDSTITGRKTQTIQTHNAVSVGASTSSTPSTWIDCNGFDKIAFTMINDAVTISAGSVFWSNDGSTIQGDEQNVVISNTLQQKAGLTDVKARYAKFRVFNGDVAAHTMSAWAYLKS